MADPLTLGTMAVGAAGSIISGIGAATSGEAQSAAYRYKAGIAMMNEKINKQNAQWALQAGDTQAEISGLRAGQAISATKVAQGASGFDVATGSLEKVRSGQSQVAAFDQEVIRWDAAKTAYGYETKAATDVAEASLDTMAAKSASQAGTLGMIGSFISGAGGVASKWSQAKMTGMLGDVAPVGNTNNPTMGGSLY